MDGHSICLLNDSFPPQIDGVANAVVNYAKNINAHHGRASVVTPSDPNAQDGKFDFPVRRYPSLDTSRLVGYRAGYPFSPETAAALQKDGTELLHVHCPVASMLMARSLRHTVDAPIVLTYHTKFDIDIANAIRGKLLQEQLVRVLVQNISAADEVWVVSRGAGENLRSLGYEGEYRVMENGVDMPRGRVSGEKIAEVTARFDLPRGVPVFLFVGRLMWYKGIRLILDALARLCGGGRDFRMVFIGGGGDEQEIRSYVQEQGLAEKCLFAGKIYDREALRAWYCRADLFLFPSTFDTNGLVVREAAACSLASVLVQGSCAAEGVTDGENGFLIEENAASLERKLTQLLDAPQALRTVGERAARELYISWEDAVAQAYDRYGTVIDRYRGGECPKHSRISDEFLRAQGDLMQVLARMEMRERELHEHRAELRDALLQKLDRYL